jgi:hypothetical protein
MNQQPTNDIEAVSDASLDLGEIDAEMEQYRQERDNPHVSEMTDQQLMLELLHRRLQDPIRFGGMMGGVAQGGGADGNEDEDEDGNVGNGPNGNEQVRMQMQMRGAEHPDGEEEKEEIDWR